MFAIMDNVLQFHAKMGQPIGDPRSPDVSVEQDFRLTLIEEELRELRIALAGFKKDPSEKGKLLPFSSKEEQNASVADALADLFYVIAGSAVAWGLDMGEVWSAVHASNMSKTPNLAGKAIKGEGFEPADVERVLAASALEFTENPDHFGDMLTDMGAAWHNPRRERVGSTKLEIEAVKAETISDATLASIPTMRIAK